MPNENADASEYVRLRLSRRVEKEFIHMLIAVQPSKITFGEMKFISARFPINTFETAVSEVAVDEIFDEVSAEIACIFGFEGVELVSTIYV